MMVQGKQGASKQAAQPPTSVEANEARLHHCQPDRVADVAIASQPPRGYP
jgi:hypothetical protein